jgi:uncharacterized protein
MALPDDHLREILTKAKTIAVVGLSDKPDRDSNEVARYLQGEGYRIVPVNPMVTTVLGERSYRSIAEIPPSVTIDIVDIFRKSSEVPPIVDEAIDRKVPTVWMQLGVENPEAAGKARARGIEVIENACIMRVHRRLGLPSARTA